MASKTYAINLINVTFFYRDVVQSQNVGPVVTSYFIIFLASKEIFLKSDLYTVTSNCGLIVFFRMRV